MNNKDLISDVVNEASNRRSLLRKITVATAAVGAIAVSGGTLEADPSAPTVIDILNFALNLEYLEAEFYTIATTGAYIDALGIGTMGSVGTFGLTTGGNMVAFSNNLVFSQQVALEIANDERDHVTLLRGALGNAAVAKPAINLNALVPLGAGFGNLAQFLNLARTFEDIGVSAYAGATSVPSVAASGAYLTVAAQILAAEAEHVGNIRMQCARLGVQTLKLDGVDIPPPPTGTQFISVNNTTGLAATRTPGQVLYLAYGFQAGVTSGGFFPNGVNGNIVTSSASA